MWIGALLIATACGASGDDDGAGGDGGPDADADAGDAGGGGCPRALAAEGPRRVVVALPYDAEGDPAARYRVLTLGVDGELDDPEEDFTMGRAVYGEIAFTPDGEVAIVAQNDGTLGVVAFDGEGGAPRVVHAGLDAGMYAAEVKVDPRGDRLYVIDSQWRENGGGVYVLPIACDGVLGDAELIYPAKLAQALHPLPDDRLAVVARDVLDSRGDRDAHLVDVGAAPEVLDSVDGFPDDDSIVSSSTLTTDQRFLLVADTSEFSGVPTRIAAIEIVGDMLAPRQILDIEDPVAVLASPFDDVVLVVSGYGDALFALDYLPDDDDPLALRDELDYVGPGPMLPSDAVMVDRGPLAGLVLVSEVGGVRRVRFGEGGAVTDLGATPIGDGGLEWLLGAIGVAP